MRIILLGAGFIGFHLSKALHERAELVVINRSGVMEAQRFPGVTYIQGDCTNEQLLKQVIRPDDVVVFLAYNSVPKTSFEEPLKDINENLPMAVSIFNVVKDIPIKKIIYISSGGTIYGKTPEASPICEKHSTNPISPYGITKLSIEKYAHFYAALFNLPVIIARPSNPFGEHQLPFKGQGFIATAIASMLRGQDITIFGKHGTIRDYLYIDDLTSALVALIFRTTPFGEIYNIGSGQGMSNIDILNELQPYAIASGVRFNTVFQPERSFDVPYNVLNPSKLMQLGWKPATSFQEGLKRTYNWILSQHF